MSDSSDAIVLGYVRLADAAPLIMAQELGFFARHGLQVELRRERSWASLRDKLMMGLMDAAQMLAPLALYMTAGVGCVATPVVTGLALGRNGNAMAISSTLARQMGLHEPWRSPLATAQRIGEEIRQRKLVNGEPLRLGTVHPFSVHTIQWCQFLRAAGADWRQTRLTVLPPDQMVDALERGDIDAFNAGAPWYAVAVARQVGTLLVAGVDVWRDAPEKVLAVTESWHQAYPDAHLRLRLALMEALEWLRDGDNRRAAAQALAQPAYLDLPESVLAQGLVGTVYGDRDAAAVPFPDFHRFDGQNAAYPWHAHARRCLQELASLAPLPAALDADALVSQVYRTDLYAEAAAALGWSLPGADDAAQAAMAPVLGGEIISLAHSVGA